jgi:Protein of unknown function (DUF2844)
MQERIVPVPIHVVVAACVLLLVPAIAPAAWGALGQPAATVEHDQVMMKGQRHSRSADGYSVDTITVAGMQIKEYVSPDGIVFAVVWKGTGMPDLPLLLGEFFDDYQAGVSAARRRAPRARQPFRMKSERLVVERAGHSRSLWGRAYLPAHIPAGVKPEDIQ